MVLYDGGEDIPLRDMNTSRKYYTGRIVTTNDYEEIKVLGQLVQGYTYPNGKKDYRYFLVALSNGDIEVRSRKGMKKAAYLPRGVIRVGTIVGIPVEYTYEYNRVLFPKEWRLFYGMFYRCYSDKEHKRFPSYVGCGVVRSWRCFATFCKDLTKLEGYTEWKQDKNKKNNYALDKDIKIKDNKIYSKDTCMFVTHSQNSSDALKRRNLTGLTYIATNVSTGYQEEFTNQAEFAEKYNLNGGAISSCIHKKIDYVKNWVFSVKEAQDG